MSYAITVTVDGDGVRVATSGSVQNGVYTIQGHIDAQREDISAERQLPGNVLASRTSSTVYKEV
jgi:hypothetical protein